MLSSPSKDVRRMPPFSEPNRRPTDQSADLSHLSTPDESLIPHNYFEKNVVLNSMLTLGTNQVKGFQPTLVDSIDNSRIPPHTSGWERQEHDGAQVLAPLQKVELFKPIIDRLNRIILEKYFAPTHEVIGDYPLGFSLTVHSEMEASELLYRNAPVSFLASLDYGSSTISDQAHEKLGELQGEDFKRELFVAYVEEYQRLIAPRLPPYLTDTPHFGGVSFSYAWQDCWQNPGSMTLLMKDVFKDLTPESRERPYQVFAQFRDEVVSPLSRRANDLFRSIFLGTIYPILNSAGIGIPTSTDLEVAFHRDAKDVSDFENNVRLSLSINFNPTLPREFMAQFGRDVIRTQFRHLIYAEFGAFCQHEVFPAIARLPVDVRDLCVGLKFKLNKEFTFEK